ncbi:hypothetical protein [Pandoraea pnomenusa]|uniref:hypothetical protein n=1 Tax=Pandoraea pnomenusa TaxID=93220 RepID=UPI00333EF16E
MPLQSRPSDLTIDQLRSLWLTNKDPDLRRAIEEVAFRRQEAARRDRVLLEVERLYVLIHQAWREEVGDTLIASECLKALLGQNKETRGESPRIPGARPR